jgi:PAS domain S-box-containing protein
VTPSPHVSILVVDDNPSKRLALTSALTPLGYHIVEAESGLDALRAVMISDFAVILLDVRMPDMDGFETAGLIRQRRESEMTPIIFVTAYASDEFVADRYVEGAVDFMFAPVQPDELRAKVSVFANLFLKAEKLASQARGVQASADQLTLMTDAAPVGIFQTDENNRYIYTNPQWTQITGIPTEDALAQKWDFILGSTQREALLHEAAAGIFDLNDLTRRFELRVKGEARIVLMNFKCIPSMNGGIAGWVGTLSDVTAQVEAEAAMAAARDKATEASQLKSDFLANMSHEIRTPMNGIMGMAEMLLETDLDTRQRDYAETVNTSGDALLAIINDILDFSKIEAGMLEIEDIAFDLGIVVHGVLDLLAGAARGKSLVMKADIDDSIAQSLMGDPGRVRQVLINLVGNAIKFTKSGEIIVQVKPSAVDGKPVTRFEVLDTGSGIAPDRLATIFQPFVQANASTAREYGGSGLGLAISAQLVGLMGGQCGLSSVEGTGTTFWFTLPLRSDVGSQRPGRSPEPEAAESVETPPRASNVTHARLLLVEDDPINQKVALAMLAGTGYEVDAVPNGASAVSAVTTQPYDLILMDCQMPGLSGYETTAAIREHEGLARHTPIIAMTAGARPEDEARCLAEGMDSYLAKPIGKQALLTLIGASLDRVAT